MEILEISYFSFVRRGNPFNHVIKIESIGILNEFHRMYYIFYTYLPTWCLMSIIIKFVHFCRPCLGKYPPFNVNMAIFDTEVYHKLSLLAILKLFTILCGGLRTTDV
uniref:Uncharacterized protein n=1 Tax=Cacopsylla melanoneura TaxID=428564 RepID=A0A8D8UNU9_9HEMI